MVRARWSKAALSLASLPFLLGMGSALPPSELRVAALQRPNGTSPLLWDHLPTQSSILWGHDTAFEWAYLEGKPRVVPLLASEPLAGDASHRRFVLKIRSGVRFNVEGAPRTLTAQDFVDSWRRLSELPLGSSARRLFADQIESLQVVDPLTLNIRLKGPDRAFVQKLTLGFTAPSLKQGEVSVGTGPWTLQTWFPGKKAIWQATRGYSNSFYPTQGSEESHRKGLIPPAGDPQGLALPRTDQLVQTWYEEPARAFKDFLEGKLDLLPLDSTLLEQALVSRGGSSLKPELSSRGIRLEQALTHDLTLAILNPRTLKDARVRARILSHLGPVFWQEALSCDASLLGDSTLPMLKDWGIPPQKIQSAPKPGKVSTSPNPLRVDWATLDGSVNVPESASIALGNSLEGAGFQVIVEPYPLQTARARFERGESDLVIIGWHWNLPRMEELTAPLIELLPEGSKELKSLRAAIEGGSYDKLRQALSDAAVWSPGPRQRATLLLQPWVFGYKMDPLHSAPEKYLRVDRELRRNYEAQSRRGH